MALKAWFLLILFLLAQGGALVASAGPSESSRTGSAVSGDSVCAADSCCCAEQAGASPRCACAEAPLPAEPPLPAIPSAPAAGRDLLPAPVWIEVCACERPGPSGRPTLVRPRLRPAAVVAPARVALTVRFCAFLI